MRVQTITIGGLPGTGTSTLCKLLAERLSMPYMYAGGLFREEAIRRGMTLAEFSALCQRDPSVDAALDDRQLGVLRKGGLIVEGRLAGWLASRHRLPALKIWLTCDPKERVRRVVRRDGGDEDTQRAATEAREASEADRYRRYYGADIQDKSHYDLILDSTESTPEALMAEVVRRVEAEVARSP
ncbi:MAG: (d)CMP kinase [Thermoplasmatota archaeon]